jgi:hypothetical protein
MTLPNGTLAVYGEVALLLAFLMLQVVVFVAMLRRSYRFKQLFLYQWFAIPIVFVLDTVWISAILNVPMSQMLAGNALVAPILSFVVTGIWVAYVYKSVRVRNTFTKTGASGQWRLAEFRDSYFLDQGIQRLADALARFIHAAEPVLGALQKLARSGEVASHDNTH